MIVCGVCSRPQANSAMVQSFLFRPECTIGVTREARYCKRRITAYGRVCRALRKFSGR